MKITMIHGRNHHGSTCNIAGLLAKNKAKVFFFVALCVSITCFGCRSGMHENTEAENENYIENATETSENLEEYFNFITDDMLDSCNMYPTMDSYWNDSLVLLNEFNDDIRLYGINSGEESAMLLYVQNEKVLLNYTFKNFYQELPKLSSKDIDNDGVDEIIVSRRTGSGSPGNWYALLVCDNDAVWNIYEYDDYVQDIHACINYQYDEDSDTIAFLDREEKVLTEIELPEWTEEYPYKGVVEFENEVRFDAETMQMEVTPWILLENSLPYTAVTMVFSVRYINGEFEIEYHHVVELAESENEDEIITKYIDEYVKMGDDVEVESTEWIEHDTNQCLRIRIQYKIQPEEKYRHKEDYFLFFNEDNEVVHVFWVDYADIELGSGNDFNAYFEDITFDGNQDLLIHIGSWGYSQFYCAFIYDNGDYKREESFEAIPDYVVVADKQQIVGNASTISTDITVTYTYSNGQFECIDRIENNK